MSEPSPRTAVVIGNFDGVHPGHQAVLKAARELSQGLKLVAVTFWPHTMRVLRPKNPPKLLTSLDERVELLIQYGADEVEVVEFTLDIASESPADFVRTVIGPLEPKVVVVGENFRFGSKAAGDVSTLAKLGKGRFEVIGLPLVRFADEETCSTRIREALEAGNVRHAAEHLGRLFAFRGKVVHGDHRGHSLGFPTANVAIPDDREAPADGVYAGWLTRLDGLDGCGGLLVGGEKPTRFPAAISVGNNPTFEAGAKRRIEAHIPGRDDLDLYGAPVSVEFVERLRGMVKFNSKDELIAQMKADVDETLELLA